LGKPRRIDKAMLAIKEIIDPREIFDSRGHIVNNIIKIDKEIIFE